MDMKLKKELMQVLEDLHWLPLKPVQEKTVPLFLEGRNLLVQAATGSGKTGAYLLPVLEKIRPFEDAGYALIIAPTRELALQIRETADLLSSYLPVHSALLIGGIDPSKQNAELKQKPQIIIGTPGRIVYMLEQNLLSLSSLQVLIADEADMILSTGQADEFRTVLAHIDHPVQTVCFSATLTDEVSSFLKDGFETVILDETGLSGQVSSYHLVCEDRYASLLDILEQQPVVSAIIFVRHRSDTAVLAGRLKKKGYLAEAFSAYDDEKTRLQVMRSFREGRIRLLAATDAASRGLDITGLSHIIHYDLPEDENTLIHRSGRSGHQDEAGISIILIPEEETSLPKVRTILSDTPQLPPHSGNPNDLSVPLIKEKAPQAEVITLQIKGGRDEKIRPGDIAGALSAHMPFEKIGRITVNEHDSTVILFEPHEFKELKIKGKKRKIRKL